MKRIFLIIFLVSGLNSMFGQYKYKVEYNWVWDPGGMAGSLHHTLTAYTNSSAHRLYTSGALSAPSTHVRDEVIELTAPIEHIDYDSAHYRCEGAHNVFNGHPNLLGYFVLANGEDDEIFCRFPTGPGRIIQILDLDVINNEAVTNGYKQCETAIFNAYRILGPVSGALAFNPFRYALRYRHSRGSGVIFNYGRRNAVYEFQMSDIPGLRVNEPFQLIVNYAKPGDTPVEQTVSLRFFECSPEQVGLVQTSDNTCFQSNNGSASITFNKNVSNGAEMRYFIYQGDPASFTGNLESESVPNDALSDYRLPALTNNGDGTFSGSTQQNLEAGNYFIIYQEVVFNGLNVTVKSGEITEQFTIGQPSQVRTGIDTVLQPRCVNETGTVQLTPATGGAEQGAGVVEYSIAGQNNWQTSRTFNNLLQGQTYRFVARRRANGNSCVGATTSAVNINQITTSVTVDNTTGVIEVPFNPTASNGRIRVSLSNGNAPYTYILRRINANGTETTAQQVNTSTNPYIFSNLEAGNYRIDVEDATGCTASSAIIVMNALDVPTFGTPAVNEIQCTGDTNGSISIPVNDAAQLRWLRNGTIIPGITTPIISNRGPGTYVLQAIPSGGNFSNSQTLYSAAPIQLTNPEPVRITNAIATDISCYGAQDGSIALTVSGGVSYEYTIDSGATWNALQNNRIPVSTLGFYDVQIRNENNCLSNIRTDVFVDEPLELSILEEDRTVLNTFGASNGAIDISVLRDGIIVTDETFTYIWTKENSSFTANTEDLSNLTAGVYNVEVRDANATAPYANGCVVRQQFEISQPNKIEAIIDHASCNAAANGRITLDVNEGDAIPDISFRWTDSSNNLVSTTNPATGLAAGRYDVFIEGLPFNTTEQFSYIIEQPDPLNLIQDAVIRVSEFGANDGAIAVSVQGGTLGVTSSYTYLWTGPEGFTATTEDINNLISGTYTLEVRDDNAVNGVNNGCVLTEAIFVGQPDIIEASIIRPTCIGGVNGSINVVVNEGIGTFDYLWNTGATTAVLQDVPAGDYSVTIEGLPNGTQQRSYTIEEPIALLVDLASGVTEQPWNPTATNGAVEIITQDGTAPYRYALFNANTNALLEEVENIQERTYEFTGLGEGRYFITTLDANGCREQTPIIPLEALAVPQIQEVNTLDILCIEGNSGAIAALVTNAAAFRWFKNGQLYPGEQAILNNLSSGTYVLEVIPEGGDFNIPATVVRSEAIVLNDPAPVLVSLEAVTDITCYDFANGVIEVFATGGELYQYELNNSGLWLPLLDGTIPIIRGGTYDVLIRNEKDCISNRLSEVVVKEPTPIQVNLDVLQNASAFQENDGVLAITVSGGTPPYLYEWEADNGFVSNQPDINNLRAGNYTLRVTDANATEVTNGCVFNATYEITEPDIIVETITAPTCFEGCDGRISLRVNEGIGTFTYLWSNGSTTSEITDLCAGDYTVTVLGLPQGEQTRTYTVENPEPLTLAISEQRTFCKDQDVIVSAIVDSDLEVAYQWTGPNGFTATGAEVIVPVAGDYTVSATDADGCMATESVTLIQRTDAISAAFAMSSQIFTGSELIIVDISYPLPDTVAWELPEEATLIKQDNDELVLAFEAPGVYPIAMETTIGDCKARTVKEVLVLQSDTISPVEDTNSPSQTIENFILYPNPSNGQFNVDVELGQIGAVAVKVFSFASNLMVTSQSENGETAYTLNFNISNMPSGTYGVVLETPYGTALQKIVKI